MVLGLSLARAHLEEAHNCHHSSLLWEPHTSQNRSGDLDFHNRCPGSRRLLNFLGNCEMQLLEMVQYIMNDEVQQLKESLTLLTPKYYQKSHHFVPYTYCGL